MVGPEELLLPPQPTAAANRRAQTNSPAIAYQRRRNAGILKRKTPANSPLLAANNPAGSARFPAWVFPLCKLAFAVKTVRVAVVLAPESVTEAGTEQVICTVVDEGVQVRFTVPENPFAAAIVIVEVPLSPGLAILMLLLAERKKCGVVTNPGSDEMSL